MILAIGKRKLFGNQLGRKYGKKLLNQVIFKVKHRLARHRKMNRPFTHNFSFVYCRKSVKSYKKIWIPHWIATEHAVVRDIKVPAWKQVSSQMNFDAPRLSI